MAKVIAFFVLISTLFAEIIEIDQLEQILPYVDATTWVLFDVDQILLETETQTPSIVRQVQLSAGAVFGLTARYPPVCPATLKQLAYIGIDLTFNAPICPSLNDENKALTLWKGGVLFMADVHRQGDVLRKWLELSPIRPSKIIFIDDGKNHLESLMSEIGVPCTCFHYIKTGMKGEPVEPP